MIVETLLLFCADNFRFTRKLPAIEFHFLLKMYQLVEMLPQKNALYGINEFTLPVNYQRLFKTSQHASRHGQIRWSRAYHFALFGKLKGSLRQHDTLGDLPTHP